MKNYRTRAEINDNGEMKSFRGTHAITDMTGTVGSFAYRVFVNESAKCAGGNENCYYFCGVGNFMYRNGSATNLHSLCVDKISDCN